MEHVIEVRGLTKRYGTLTAVDRVDLAVPEGICFGLLGPNGAGKTTMIEIMEGIRDPTSGTVRYRGGPLDSTYRDRVGIQFQQTALQQYITVRETLHTFGRLYSKRRDIDELVAMCDLTDLLDRDNQKLSGGQRQRMLLALALINDPDIIFLDEPTTGLD
ncbi:MAG: ABC transporter ATP-binding protein, partial [Spirochaetales bacterium]|nr:ABC transporter ATP-binding protein [Spirochaetales bacterium]